jgi:hypothetical protein
MVTALSDTAAPRVFVSTHLVAGSGAADLEDAFARLIEGAGAEAHP